jgi:TQO small subunit DoxD
MSSLEQEQAMTASSPGHPAAVTSQDRSPHANTLIAPAARWERRLQQAALVLARIGLAYLFFTQLWWKIPPTFGCGPDFAFTTGQPGQLQRTRGLCDWIGIESVYSNGRRPFFTANLDNKGGPDIAVDLGWAARLNGVFIDNVVKPNIRWFGYVIFGMEAFIFMSLFFGLFSRLGGLVAIAQSLQLMIGLAGIPNPAEWEWGYILMVVVAILVFAFAPGRYFGLDALLRPRLMVASEHGNRLARLVLWLT